MQNTIKFEMADWVEIVEALGSKIHMIQSGQLAPEDRSGQDKEWIAPSTQGHPKNRRPEMRRCELRRFQENSHNKKRRALI